MAAAAVSSLILVDTHPSMGPTDLCKIPWYHSVVLMHPDTWVVNSGVVVVAAVAVV